MCCYTRAVVEKMRGRSARAWDFRAHHSDRITYVIIIDSFSLCACAAQFMRSANMTVYAIIMLHWHTCMHVHKILGSSN
jgi:hypothetical protein